MSDVEVDVMIRLVGDVRAEIASDDAVPRRTVRLVEFALEKICDVLLGVARFLERLQSPICGVLLQLDGHVAAFDDRFQLSSAHLFEHVSVLRAR